MEYNKPFVLKSLIENEPDFQSYSLEEVLQIGNCLGTSYQLFREFYLAYRRLEHQFETKPKIDAKITVEFIWEEKLVTVEPLAIKLQVEQAIFLKFYAFITFEERTRCIGYFR